MYFSIIIPTLNEQKYIARTLRGLNAQTNKDFEVIIVDGKSEDSTLKVIEENKGGLKLKVIQPPKRGVSFQRNFGAANAKYDNIMFFDADTFVESDFIQKIAEYIKTNPVDVLTVYNIPISDKTIDHVMAHVFNDLYLQSMKNINPGAVGTFMYFKKAAFKKLGGFDLRISCAEDFEIVRRAHKEGMKYALLKTPVVYFSVRRAEKEGRAVYLAKMLKMGMYYYLKGPLKAQGKVKWEFGKHI